MRVDPHTVAPMGSRRALAYTGVLATLVVVAAGVSGTIHFAGPRWVPHFKVARHTPTPPRLPRSSTRPRTIPAPHGSGGFPTVIVWILVGIAVVGVALLLWRWWAGRPAGKATGRRSAAGNVAREIAVEPEPEPEPTPALLTGIELALQVLDEQREPADAIVRAWLGLQETAEESGIARRPAETPTEFTARILSGAFADDRAVRTLLRLYLRTRFGNHPVTGEDVAAVRAALQELVRTWRTPDSRARAGAR